MRAIIQMVGANEPIIGELEDLPPPTATLIYLKHPQKHDGSHVRWVDHRTAFLALPVAQIISIEIMDPKKLELEHKSKR